MTIMGRSIFPNPGKRRHSIVVVSSLFPNALWRVNNSRVVKQYLLLNQQSGSTWITCYEQGVTQVKGKFSKSCERQSRWTLGFTRRSEI